MTKILYFALKIKGSGREGGTCKVLRPCHPLKIWNVHHPDAVVSEDDNMWYCSYCDLSQLMA